MNASTKKYPYLKVTYTQNIQVEKEAKLEIEDPELCARIEAAIAKYGDWAHGNFSEKDRKAIFSLLDEQGYSFNDGDPLDGSVSDVTLNDESIVKVELE